MAIDLTGYVLNNGYWYKLSDGSGPYYYNNFGTPVPIGGSGSSGSLPAISLATRIRAGATVANLGNPAAKAPLVSNPPWAANTQYYHQGYVVVNGVNLYVLHVVGTTAATGSGPTGTGANLITDGTCKWFYAGPYVVPAVYPLSPIVTYASPTGLTKYVPPFQSGAFFYSGGTPTLDVYGNGYGFPVSNVAPNAGNVPNNAGTSYATYNAQSQTITFMSDAPKICIGGYIHMSPYMGVHIEVDGQPLMQGTMCPLTDINPGGVVIDWNGLRKARKYRVWLDANYSWYGVYVDSASVVYAAANPNRFRVVVNGDSLTSGAGGVPYTALTWPDIFAGFVGCDDIYNCAAGGSGFLGRSEGTGRTFIERLPDVLGFHPDVHIIAGNNNDSAFASADRVTAMVAYLTAFRAGSAAPVLFFGPTSGRSGASAWAALENDIATAVAQVNDPLITFIPVSTAVPPWIDGTGAPDDLKGDGNADVYMLPQAAPHYTQDGIAYVAKKYAQAWGDYWLNKPTQ